jgi:hypothetical protein
VKHTWSLLVLLALRASLLLAGGYFIVGFGKRCRGGGLRQLPLLVREVERRNEVLVTRDVRDGLVGVVTGRIPFPLNLIQLKSIAGGTTDNGIYLIKVFAAGFACWVCDMPWRSIDTRLTYCRKFGFLLYIIGATHHPIILIA